MKMYVRISLFYGGQYTVQGAQAKSDSFEIGAHTFKYCLFCLLFRTADHLRICES